MYVYVYYVSSQQPNRNYAQRYSYPVDTAVTGGAIEPLLLLNSDHFIAFQPDWLGNEYHYNSPAIFAGEDIHGLHK